MPPAPLGGGTFANCVGNQMKSRQVILVATLIAVIGYGVAIVFKLISQEPESAKSTQVTFLAELAAVIGCIVIGYLVAHRPPSIRWLIQRARPRLARHVGEIDARNSTAPDESSRWPTQPRWQRASSKPQKTCTNERPAPTDPPIVINGYDVQDPMARLALNFVGSDPDAKAYWVGAINDSSLPAEERKDLIEDLNEDGLSDSHHPTAEDMPLIMRRIQLIEQLAPTAMDDVNRDALAEAHKDLVGLLKGQEPQ